MCQWYKTIVSHLESDTRFMLEYQKTITNQELEIERLELENRNLEYELERFDSDAYEHSHQKDEKHFS